MPDSHPTSPNGSARLSLAAVSLANLFALRCWASVLDPSTQYFLDAPRPWQAYAGTLLLFAALAGAATAASLAAHRAPRAGEIAFFAALALTLHLSREQIADLAGRPVRTFVEEPSALESAISLLAIGLLPVAFLPARARAHLRRGAVTALLVLSPFILVTSGQTAFAAARAAAGRSGIADRPAASPRAHAAANRVVVLVLDEWDQLRTFEDRPPGIELPSIDAFAAEAVHVRRGVPPAHVTELVLPSLLTGRAVVDARDAGPSDRILVFSDGETGRASDMETFLSDVRAGGGNAALAGWYHPYCRILGDDLVDCVSRAIRPELARPSIASSLRWQALRLNEAIPHGRKLRRLLGAEHTLATPKDWHEESARLLHAAALRLIADPRLDVVFLHLPLPHPPYLSDRRYEGNLLLADEMFGELLAALDASGLTPRTSVFVLADHPLRGPRLTILPSPRLAEGEPRPVPMLIRMRGGGGPRWLDEPVSTLLLRDLVVETWDGDLATNDDLVSALQTASARASHEGPAGR